MTVELAGVQPDSFDIVLYEDALVVEGCRELLCKNREGVYHTVEIRQGLFF